MRIGPPPPSGEQFEISAGAARAIVVEVGAGLREYTLDAVPVLDGYPLEAMCDGARGQLLAPWPNRLAGGSYTFHGESLQLPLTEPENDAAIHGLVRWVNFRCIARQRDSVTLAYQLHPQPGWPFHLDLEICYLISARGLLVRTTARNPAGEACPYGTGAHPYLWAGGGMVDTAILKAPAQRYFPVDASKIPVGCEPVAATEFDFREPRPVGSCQLDLAFTDLVRDRDGKARVRFSLPDREVTLWLGEAYRYLELFTGDSLADPQRRRRGLAVEPMTCAPNAYRSGDGLVVLEPGAEHVAEWGIEVG
ncbi:MAG: aldose 1-epimerase family protein [Mycobacteriales bacterium]